jgi:adenylate kinase
MIRSSQKIVVAFIVFGCSLLPHGGFSEEKQPESKSILILLGPPGSGKGSQAVELKEKMHLAHISTGDLLRKHVQNGTELGKKAKSFMEKGELVPDAIILDMLFDRIQEPDCQKGYILDGFPRTVAQAEALQSRLPKQDKLHVINLDISDAAVVDRITQRQVCSQCSASYHLQNAPSKKKDICDKCESKLQTRADDTKEVVLKRLAVYHNQTAPLIEFYNKRHVMTTLDASQPKEVILNKIMNIAQKELITPSQS